MDGGRRGHVGVWEMPTNAVRSNVLYSNSRQKNLLMRRVTNDVALHVLHPWGEHKLKMGVDGPNVNDVRARVQTWGCREGGGSSGGGPGSF